LKKTFEHLLGLTVKDALAILKSAGIFDVRVTFTSAPARPAAQRGCPPDEPPGDTTMLRAVADQFTVSEDGEAAPDPLLEPALTDDLLVESRVVGVRGDGRQLIVSRFRVTPKPGNE
jgi:hypothetical protein